MERAARDFRADSIRCLHQRRTTAHWLQTTFEITADEHDDHYAPLYACENGHVEIVNWLFDTVELTADDIQCSHKTTECAARAADRLLTYYFLCSNEMATSRPASTSIRKPYTARVRSVRNALQSRVKPAAR